MEREKEKYLKEMPKQTASALGWLIEAEVRKQLEEEQKILRGTKYYQGDYRPGSRATSRGSARESPRDTAQSSRGSARDESRGRSILRKGESPARKQRRSGSLSFNEKVEMQPLVLGDSDSDHDDLPKLEVIKKKDRSSRGSARDYSPSPVRGSARTLKDLLRNKEVRITFFAAGMAMPWGTDRFRQNWPRDGTGPKDLSRSVESVLNHEEVNRSCLGIVVKMFGPGELVWIDLRRKSGQTTVFKSFC